MTIGQYRPARKGRLVYNGKLFRIYAWQQRLYDGTYSTFERMERPDIVQITPVIDGKIGITIEQQPDSGQFVGQFGGGMEPGEKPLEAAKREFLEEAGMVAKRWILYKTFRHVGKVTYTVYNYIARDCSKVGVQKLDPGERIRTRLVSLPKFLSMVRTMRTGDDFRIYICEMLGDPRKMRKFRSQLGI